MATFLCNSEHDKSKRGCPISSKSVIFGLATKIHLFAIQEIAVSSTAMTHTYWSSPFFVPISYWFVIFHYFDVIVYTPSQIAGTPFFMYIEHLFMKTSEDPSAG